jgi:flagellar biosynthesis component FlhA
MSSKYVRDEIKSFITTNIPSETNVLDLTMVFEDIEDFLTRKGVNYDENWIGLQFVGAEEEPITVRASNDVGCYRESGAIYVHVIAPATRDMADTLLDRAETVRNAFRGQRIDTNIMIDTVAPPNSEVGTALEFEGGWQSAAVLINYRRDLNL